MTGLALDTIHTGDALTVLKTLPDGCVNCIVTSPPYFGLRSYLPDEHPDKAQELGAEPTPSEYVAALVGVLRDDGVLWLNLGSSYGPNKQELGIPWRVAFALQDDGWVLRADVIWAKANPMPESVTDRPTKAHEYVFLLSKQPRYWYDAQAVAEESIDPESINGRRNKRNAYSLGATDPDGYGATRVGFANIPVGRTYPTRNRRSVWTINPANFRGAHFATMPEELAEVCIKAGCPEWCCEKCGAPWVAQVETVGTIKRRWSSNDTAQHDDNLRNDNNRDTQLVKEVTGYAPTCTCNAGKRSGVVLDPFSGAGTTALVAKKLNRRYIGIELNPEYAEMARARIDGIPYTLFSLMEVAGD